jgi:hypothetical protein
MKYSVDLLDIISLRNADCVSLSLRLGGAKHGLRYGG